MNETIKTNGQNHIESKEHCYKTKSLFDKKRVYGGGPAERPKAAKTSKRGVCDQRSIGRIKDT